MEFDNKNARNSMGVRIQENTTRAKAFKMPLEPPTAVLLSEPDFTALKTRSHSTSTPLVSNRELSRTDDSGYEDSSDIIKSCLFPDISDISPCQNITQGETSGYHSSPSHEETVSKPLGARYTMKQNTNYTGNYSHNVPIVTPISRDSRTLDDFLRNFSPNDPARIIGRKMGLENVDVIHELNSRNISTCLQKILSYLEPKDLCRFCLVSTKWKETFHKFQLARRRKSQYFGSLRENMKQKGLENVKILEKSPQRPLLTRTTEPLGNVQRLGTSQLNEPSSPPKQDRHNEFVEEGRKLKLGESLRKCPSCGSASKYLMVEEMGLCSRQSCGKSFCTRCLGDYHGSQPCESLSAKRTAVCEQVGGKKSKRNLRRL